MKDTFFSNCLFWAIYKCFKEKNGYLVMRKSREGWYPHFLWMSPEGEVFHFQPVVREVYKYCPPLIFEGYVKVGDKI